MNQPDTLSLFLEPRDSIPQDSSAADIKVFEGEFHSLNSNYPFSVKLERELSPDWILFFSLAALALFSWIHMIYSRIIINIFQASFSYQLAVRLYNDPNMVQKRISVLFSFVYFITAGLFSFLLYKYFSPEWFSQSDFVVFMMFSGFLAFLALFRTFVFRLTGFLFDQGKIYREALFHNFLFNKVTGIVIVPFIILAAYTQNSILDISVWTGLVIFALINMLRLLRAVIFVNKNVISLFYFILYLCSLEILPILVIFKLVLYLAKGS